MKKITLLLSIFTLGYFTAYSQTIVNPGFEDWELDSSFGTPTLNPTGWSTFNFGEDPDMVNQSTDAHGGSYSAKINPISIFGSQVPAFLGFWDISNQKLGYLNGYYKSQLTSIDTFAISLEYNNSTERYNFFQMSTGSKSTWTPFNIKIDLPSSFIPDTFSITFIVFGAGNPYGMIDDLSFSNTPIGNPFGKSFSGKIKGLNKTTAFNASLSPNPVNNMAMLEYNVTKPSSAKIVITDLLGKEVKIIDNQEIVYGPQRTLINTEDIKPGIYFYSVITSDNTVTRRFVVSR